MARGLALQIHLPVANVIAMPRLSAVWNRALLVFNYRIILAPLARQEKEFLTKRGWPVGQQAGAVRHE
jgi:hypothetical protein